MSKPSTDTQTERDVERWRRERMIPARVTLRFLALLRPGELETLERKFKLMARNHVLSGHGSSEAINNRRRNLARARRVHSERKQRGHAK